MQLDTSIDKRRYQHARLTASGAVDRCIHPCRALGCARPPPAAPLQAWTSAHTPGELPPERWTAALGAGRRQHPAVARYAAVTPLFTLVEATHCHVPCLHSCMQGEIWAHTSVGIGRNPLRDSSWLSWRQCGAPDGGYGSPLSAGFSDTYVASSVEAPSASLLGWAAVCASAAVKGCCSMGLLAPVSVKARTSASAGASCWRPCTDCSASGDACTALPES